MSKDTDEAAFSSEPEWKKIGLTAPPRKAPTWDDLRRSAKLAVDLIDSKADLSEIRLALLRPWKG